MTFVKDVSRHFPGPIFKIMRIKYVLAFKSFPMYLGVHQPLLQAENHPSS